MIWITQQGGPYHGNRIAAAPPVPPSTYLHQLASARRTRETRADRAVGGEEDAVWNRPHRRDPASPDAGGKVTATAAGVAGPEPGPAAAAGIQYPGLTAGEPAEAGSGRVPTSAAQPPTDKVLATRAALGDRGAFADIVRRHGPSMYRYALRMLDGDHQGAEDAVQDALTDAWVNLPGFRHESALHTWLFRIGANRVLSERRRRRSGAVDDRLLSTQPEPSYRGPAQRAEHEHLWESLDLALTELPWRQRASWILRELEGLSYAEIAQILHTTPTVVRGQLHRARRALAIRMEQWR